MFHPENRVLVGQDQYPNEEIISKRLTERGATVEHVEISSEWSFVEFRDRIYPACLDSDYVSINFFVVPSFAIGTLVPPINAVRLFYMGILSQARNVIITSFGDPYVFINFQAAATYMCTFDQTTASQEMAVRAWFGEEPVRGRMPVSLAHCFARGDGIDLN